MAAQPSTRGRWVAIVTGALSVLIGVIYLVLITVLDSRGPMSSSARSPGWGGSRFFASCWRGSTTRRNAASRNASGNDRDG